MENKESIKRYIVRDVHGNILDENGFSVVGGVHVTVEPGYGEPSADVEYVGGELYLTLHNIEGNGITEIVTDSQEGDEAVNTVTIKTNDNPEGVVMQVKNGSKGNRGNGITSIETQESQEDGGENTVTIKTTDNPAGQSFSVRNGRRGPQGDSAVWDETSGTIVTMAHVLGQDGTKAMSQKGVTDAINSGKISNGETTQTLAQPYYNNGTTTGLYVNSSTGAFAPAAAHRSIELDLTPDMKSITYKASAYSSTNGGYAFVKNDGTYVSGVKTTSAVNVTADVRQAMAMGATKFRCSINATTGSAISLTIKKETFSWPQRYESIGDNINGWMSQRAVKEALSMNIDNVLGNIKTSRYINSSGSWNSTSSTNYAGRINIGQYKGKTIKITANSSYSAEIAFTISYPDDVTGSASEYYCAGCTKTTIPAGDVYMAVIPDDCESIYMLDHFSGNNMLPSSVIILDSVTEVVKNLPQEIAEQTSEQIAEEMEVTQDELSTFSTIYVDYYISIPSYTWGSPTGNNYANILDGFGIYKGKQIAIHAGANGNCQIAFLKSKPVQGTTGAVNPFYCTDTSVFSVATNTVYKGVVPEDCQYLYVRHMSSGIDVTPTKIVISDNMNNVVVELSEKIDAMPIVYVSSSGNDNNPGTFTAPKKTIAAALNAGAADMTVVLMSDTNETVNFSAWNGKKNHVTLRGGNKNKQARIIVGQPLNLEAYESNADVYTCTLADSETLPLADYTWLWQHGIEDTNTLISAAERHPLQRGRTYRRLSRQITSVSSLSALLAASSPCWFLDDRTLYVRTVTGSNISSNPIYYPRQEATAIKTGDFEVTLCNIEAWYGKIIVGELAASVNNMGMMFKAYDCAARYTWAQGAWRIDDGISAYLERCEADSNQYGTTGDGFNMHPSAGDTYPYGKGCTHTLVDCWAHDMKDDGYSDHGRSEGTIIGGLYEHNGKGGLAPAIGSHNTIYNTVVRNNTSGILLAGNSVGDGGIGTQIECFGVAAINNTYNFNSLASSSASNLCIMVLNKCISRNAITAALYAHDYGKIISRDTTDSGSATVKKTETNGVITIDNGTVIS